MAADEERQRSFDPADPYERQAQTFPELTSEQVERVAAFGTVEEPPKGSSLFTRGERGVDFFVVLDGSIEILDAGTEGGEEVITVHGPGQFTGELDLFSARETLVSGRTGSDSRIIRLHRRAFRRLIEAEPDIGELIVRALTLRRVGLMKYAQGGIVLVGSARDGDTLHIQRFLTRNGYPHRTVDADVDAEGFETLATSDLPALVLPDRPPLKKPSIAEVADVLGLTERVDPQRTYDVTVVGAGPAGLAAAVYGASEGLNTIVVEALAPGGQAGTSSRIENYLGFPTGLSGQALAARAQVQAQKFGARLAVSRHAAAIHCAEQPYVVELEDGQRISTRAVVIATGASYRTLGLPNYEHFEGRGIHYAATWIESNLCSNEEVVVVGGGNSAGQAAVFLSQHAAHVHMLVRGEGLASSMSDYLVQRIEAAPKITLHPFTEVTALYGERLLQSVTWTNSKTGKRETRSVSNLFVMIGAVPNTAWLQGCMPLDRGGFIVTGRDDKGMALSSPYATQRPGIFAVGDVRAQSTKRVASAVGEGSVVVQAVHAFLGDAEPPRS